MNPVFLIGAMALLICGSALLGWVLSKFVQRFQDEDSEPIHWEEWTASDGKKYLWPVDHKRSSRNKKSA